jgi:hypothetical protein
VVEKLKENKPVKEDDWIDGEEAMRILNCKKNKTSRIKAFRVN